jgi:serine/threonine protein kinase
MPATPAGFVFLPGAESEDGRVFGVAREAGAAVAGGEAPLVCKRLARRVLDEPWAAARLAGEGRLLARLGGAGVPRWVADGEDAHGPWLVVERVPWPTLGERTGRVDGAWVARAAERAFEALAALHGAGVVHGDISPRNVLVDDEGARAVLVDLGLATAPELPAMPPGPFRGTLAYAAPEVARGEPFGPQADLFAMASSLLHVAGGSAPRSQATQAAMLLSAGEEALAPWAERAARGLPASAARTLAACCAFEARDRPASAAAVLDALGPRPDGPKGTPN